MDKQTPKRFPKIFQRLLILAAVLLCLAGLRLLLGTRQMMYLSAVDIHHMEVTVTPPGTTMTASGDDAAEGVKILNKTVCYYPQQEEVAGQAVALTIYRHDGTTMTVTACGDHFTIGGKGYKTRSADGETLAAWAEALAEKPAQS